MWSRFQMGSNRPLANRRARMLSTDSLPRKWSMRKIRDSSKTAWIVSLRPARTARSVPNGFSTMTRAFSASPVSPSIADRGSKRDGRDREVEEAARLPAERLPRPSVTAVEERLGVVRVGRAEGRARPRTSSTPRQSGSTCRSRRPRPARARGRLVAECGAGPATSRRCGSRSGSRPALARWKRPGSSLRLARSPVAPKRTMRCGSGRVMVGSPSRRGRRTRRAWRTAPCR